MWDFCMIMEYMEDWKKKDYPEWSTYTQVLVSFYLLIQVTGKWPSISLYFSLIKNSILSSHVDMQTHKQCNKRILFVKSLYLFVTWHYYPFLQQFNRVREPFLLIPAYILTWCLRAKVFVVISSLTCPFKHTFDEYVLHSQHPSPQIPGINKIYFLS